MPLILREEKGSKLTIQEMDGNLVYLDNKVPYKVYTALLTQSGGDDPLQLTAGPVTKGVTYTILANSDGDFSNVGAPDNNENTSFVAINNDTPISYGTDCQLLYNNGAPVVTVLENTIGNIWFTYDQLGVYNINSINLFTSNLATFISGLEGAVGGGGGSPLGGGTGIYRTTDSLLYFFVADNGGNPTDSMIVGYPIEIRVYN